ncbi:hypothetical protein BH09PAT4_BH09PAT4_02210 [soil metagenome]
MKRLFYIRHGETDMNIAKKFSGTTEAQLTDNGRGQAKLSGEALRQKPLRIDYIVCSPLKRTQETAKIVAGEIGFPVEKIEINDLFIERHFGTLEGTPSEEFIGSPEDYRKIDAVAGAETIEALQQRAEKALAYAKSIPADNVLIVSHGAFGRALRRVVNNQPHTHEYDGIQWIGNAEIVELI